DQVDDGGEHPCDPLGQVFVDDVDLDMAGDAYAQDRPQENHHDKAVNGDFFRPGIGVVENVAREELHEDAGGHQPEHDQGDPVLESINAEIDFDLLVFERVGQFFESGLLMLRHWRHPAVGTGKGRPLERGRLWSWITGWRGWLPSLPSCNRTPRK